MLAFFRAVRDWLALIPPTLAVGGISYYSYITIKKANDADKGLVNPGIRKDINKVVDFIDIEDITGKVSLCRCWRSKNHRGCLKVCPNMSNKCAASIGCVYRTQFCCVLWPYCDGTHGTHNKETGDNTGPVVVRHKENK